MKIYVTRHGETQYSLKNIVCGSTDCQLTEKGRMQALELAGVIIKKNLHITAIYSSPLLRAKETAGIIKSAISVPCIIDSRLREQDCGAYESNAMRDDTEFNTAIRQHANRLKGGDSAFMLAQRVYNFMDEICPEGASGTPLIVAHACVCKMIHTYFHEITNEEYYGYSPGTCALVEYSYTAGA